MHSAITLNRSGALRLAANRSPRGVAAAARRSRAVIDSASRLVSVMRSVAATIVRSTDGTQWLLVGSVPLDVLQADAERLP